MMGRKAMAESVLVGIILTLVAGGVLAAATINYLGAQDCESKIQRCRTSLQFFKTLKEDTTGIAIPTRVDCPITPPCKLVKGLKGNKEQVLRGIAEHLRVCWEKTRGKDNTIGLDFKQVFAIPISPETNVDFCLVCSEFEVPLVMQNREIASFIKKETMLRSDKTYLQFLQTSKAGEAQYLEYEFLRSLPVKDASDPTKYDDEVKILEKLTPTKQYAVISINSRNGEFNHLVIAQTEDIPKYACNQFHFQKE